MLYTVTALVKLSRFTREQNGKITYAKIAPEGHAFQ